MPPPERYEPFAVDEVMSATIAEPAAVVKFQEVAFAIPAKLSARPSRIAPESTRTCIAVLPGKIAVGLIVTVNGAAPEYATLELSSVGIASITRSAVAPTAAALLPRFVTPATFDALDAAALAECGDAQRMLGRARTVDQPGGAIVTRAGVDLVELDHGLAPPAGQPERQHDQGNRDCLQHDARLHQLVGCVAVAALQHVEEASHEDKGNEPHDDDGEDIGECGHNLG